MVAEWEDLKENLSGEKKQNILSFLFYVGVGNGVGFGVGFGVGLGPGGLLDGRLKTLLLSARRYATHGVGVGGCGVGFKLLTGLDAGSHNSRLEQVRSQNFHC